ncbi:WXG100 family type VII secretion target [Nocardia ignorata]|uniref:WXG100 family type VII secretion target n=2 Tax=Nocardia ignorata TaxID=145285 RepID=A0A4R6PVE3_NOCIG|nr:WXG100 family type VII secretion target [Nocardia ignorata]
MDWCVASKSVKQRNFSLLTRNAIKEEDRMTESPGGATFAIVPQEVTDAGQYVQQVAESLINGLSSLDSEIAGVLSNWRGTSADAFTAGWAETKEGGADVLDALAVIAELLGVTSKTIAHEDNSGASNLSSLDLPTLNW